MESAKQSHVRHILVVVTCCLMMMCSSGALLNAAGIYYAAICEEFGVMQSQVVVWLSICFLAATILMPFLGKLFERFDARIICSVGVICAVIGEFIFASAQNLTTLYIGAVPVGIGLGSLGFITAPTLINRWFKKRVGTALGIAVAFSGIGGVVFNYIGSFTMSVSNWHFGFMVNGIVIAILCLPFTIFALRSYPSDLGLKMYGEGDGGEEEAPIIYGMSYKKARMSLAFYLCIFFVICGVFAVNCYQFLPSYAQSLPTTAGDITFAATLASSAMIGQLLGKIVLGVIADKSLRASIVCGMGGGVVGILCMWLLNGSTFMLLAGGFIFGLLYSSLNVINPLLVRAAFGTRDYANIFSKVSLFNALFSVFAVTALGLVVDYLGYTALFILSIALCVVMVLVAFAVVAKRITPEAGIIED